MQKKHFCQGLYFASLSVSVNCMDVDSGQIFLTVMTATVTITIGDESIHHTQLRIHWMLMDMPCIK